MKYFSQNHDVVINASGGYAALEHLGFKAETQTKEINMAKKKKVSSVKVEKGETNGKSRSELMEIVKERGVKNFRVMNKEELGMIVDGATKPQIEAIQLAAVRRWKSGWKKNKKEGATCKS